MSYIVASKRNSMNYYYIVDSVRTGKKTYPCQYRRYLGRYKQAIEKVNNLNIAQAEKEKFIINIQKKEEHSGNLLFNNLPDQKYSCIVIDPPWFYELRNKDLTHRNKIPYPPMKTEEILKLPIGSLSDPKGTVLWLWFTNNHILEASKCVEHWNFTIKTVLTWEKVAKNGNTRIGTGHWLRNCTEHCILATFGKVKSFSHLKKLTNQSTILHAQRREHSRKPDEFYELVEKLCDGNKLEMFARQKRQGWEAWGNQTDFFS